MVDRDEVVDVMVPVPLPRWLKEECEKTDPKFIMLGQKVSYLIIEDLQKFEESMGNTGDGFYNGKVPMVN